LSSEAAVAHVELLVERLRVVNRQIRRCHQRVDALCDAQTPESDGEESIPGEQCEQRDVEILRSLPGVGRIVLATLLSEASSAIKARDYHALRSLAGVSPVPRASGKRRAVVMRRACHLRSRS